MTGFIDYEIVDEIEAITGDNTIGRVHFDGDEDVETVARLDPQRLRELLILAEEELGVDDTAHVSLMDIDDDVDSPALVIRSEENRPYGMILAGKRPPRSERDDDQEVAEA